MKQTTFATSGFNKYVKKTRRAVFLDEMNQVVPWTTLCKLIEPHYPKAGNGRPPIGLERMLRIYFLQQWFNLSDPGVEEALYESISMREFVGIDLGLESAPDETTVCKFRHLLEKHELGRRVFEEVGRHLQGKGMKVSGGTIVDATIIAAPSSTKNSSGERDPEMRQTKKGNQWHFGMKGHIGIDSKTKLIHSAVVTPANVHDSQPLPNLLHGAETRIWGDSAYIGQKPAIKKAAPNARDFTNRRGTRNHALTEEEQMTNQRKSSVRAKVEHAFLVIKRIFGFTKVRFRGLAKNANRFFVTCALANLFVARRQLMRLQGA
ncbi:MAG: IS5 family transposase [Undibacterium sp.]|nr:IS5 family transposase [Undibacterium sp.]MDO9191732.1 IS5 family transposase [Undibacterium sp.]